MIGRRAGTAHARPVRQLYLDSCGDSQEYSHMFNIFRSDFQKGEGRKTSTDDENSCDESSSAIACGKCDNAFDEESDEASCAVPCKECEKRFFDEKDIQQTSWSVP